ncbi:hypothetical protein GCM10015535_31970 [Streptomyces gelaticus]|uniref:Glycoside hydrolase family 3 C-terminal domain-containing protein n=1 Tax=Streptomyces gelaticus TaxID=285446 RepID=A0ABQ2W1S4_9ACTN|nr:hypothetical protein GCM10015535_31970 [Streptomyces gelaticus]
MPDGGELPYTEGVFIGHKVGRVRRDPPYPFGHGLGYTDRTYESIEVAGTTVTVRLCNTVTDPAARSSSSPCPRPRPT